MRMAMMNPNSEATKDCHEIDGTRRRGKLQPAMLVNDVLVIGESQVIISDCPVVDTTKVARHFLREMSLPKCVQHFVCFLLQIASRKVVYIRTIFAHGIESVLDSIANRILRRIRIHVALELT